MAENNHDLDNLIIQADKSSKVKKILLAAALLLLVLIIIILVTKNFVEPEQKVQSSVILPPEPVEQTKPKDREPLFQDVPIEEEKSTPTPKPINKVEEVIEKVKKSETETAPAAATTQGSVSKSKSSMSVKKVSPKSVQPIKKPLQPSKTTQTTQTTPQKGAYYIQVGAFFRYPPDKKFLHSIEKEGLRYLIIQGSKNGTSFKKVLVGPYTTRAAAKKDLPRIKRRINQNAYITKK